MKFDLSVRNVQATAANFRAFDETLQADVRAIVKDNGLATRDLARFFAPVDTGFLRDHIKAGFGELGYSFEVGWQEKDFIQAGFAFYAIFTEFGTRLAPAQPCLFPAYQEIKPLFIADIIDAIRRSAARSGLQ